MRPLVPLAVLGALLLRTETLVAAFPPTADDGERLVYEGGEGPGAGLHVVLMAGDEEYRSEEVMPMLARILAVRHGFRCTVLFSTDPKDGTIDPMRQDHLPGMEVLDDADLLVVFLRFRNLPDESMAIFDRYVHSGKPIVALRTATHAFDFRQHPESRYRHYSFEYHGEFSDPEARDPEHATRPWTGGFGQTVLGETWVSHHGAHGQQSTRGVIEESERDHPVLRGVTDLWGPTDVYTVVHLRPEDRILVRGHVLEGMSPDDPEVAGPANDPAMPLVWTRSFDTGRGASSRVLCTTMGAAQDFAGEGLRRLLVNACLWAVDRADAIHAQLDVSPVGSFSPSPFGHGQHRRGILPGDLRLGDEDEVQPRSAGSRRR